MVIWAVFIKQKSWNGLISDLFHLASFFSHHTFSFTDCWSPFLSDLTLPHENKRAVTTFFTDTEFFQQSVESKDPGNRSEHKSEKEMLYISSGLLVVLALLHSHVERIVFASTSMWDTLSNSERWCSSQA